MIQKWISSLRNRYLAITFLLIVPQSQNFRNLIGKRVKWELIKITQTCIRREETLALLGMKSIDMVLSCYCHIAAAMDILQACWYRWLIYLICVVFAVLVACMIMITEEFQWMLASAGITVNIVSLILNVNFMWRIGGYCCNRTLTRSHLQCVLIDIAYMVNFK